MAEKPTGKILDEEKAKEKAKADPEVAKKATQAKEPVDRDVSNVPCGTGTTQEHELLSRGFLTHPPTRPLYQSGLEDDGGPGCPKRPQA